MDFQSTSELPPSSDWNYQNRFSFNDDERKAFMKNPLVHSHAERGDFTPFYVTITICSLLAFFLILFNVFFCWCSKHKYYWQDPNTGNRWIFPIWTLTPYKQPPLDLTELEEVAAERRMSLHVFWPPLVALVLFIAVVIMLMLRYGSQWCRLRHSTLPEKPDWSDHAYEQRVSYA